MTIDHASRFVWCEFLSKVKVVLNLPNDYLIISYTTTLPHKLQDSFFAIIEARYLFSFLSESFANLAVKRCNTLLTHELRRTFLQHWMFWCSHHVYRKRLLLSSRRAKQSVVSSLWNSFLSSFGSWEIVQSERAKFLHFVFLPQWG